MSGNDESTMRHDKDDIQRDSGNSSDYSSSGQGVNGTTDVNCCMAAGAVERGVECNGLAGDANMLNDERTLANLVYLEDFYRIHSNYFMFTQAEIKPWMHKTLACWMLEVCQSNYN